MAKGIIEEVRFIRTYAEQFGEVQEIGATKIEVAIDGSWEFLREFFADEITVRPETVLGKTRKDAQEAIRLLDVAYLRS